MEFNKDRYDKMIYRKCGKWGLKLPIISLGAWQTVGGYEDDGEAKKVIFEAFNSGITHFDFANNYGKFPGSAEIAGGRILKELPRDEIIISNKAGYHMWEGPYGEWGSKKYIIASCDQSLKRMGLEYFDVFYHHRPDPDTPLEETHEAIETLMRQGKVLYAAVSNYDHEMIEETIKLRERKLWSPITLTQPAYNMFNRKIENGYIESAAKYGYGIITFVPLAQGALSDRFADGVPVDSRIAKQHKAGWIDQNVISKLKKLREIAHGRGQSLSQMALAWILRYKEITSVLTAVSSIEQLRDTLKILDHLEFTEDELKEIDAILNDGVVKIS